MYTAIRRYRIDSNRVPEAIQHTLENFVPLIRQTPGLLAYYVMDAGGGALATITICESREGVEAANKMAAGWMKQALLAGIISEEGAPNVFVSVEESIKGPLYEGISEPAYKRDLQLLAVPEVSKLLGMGRSWVYQQIRTGEIPSVQLGGNVKVKRQDLEEYVERHRHSQWGEE